ncbi:MAG: YqaA family protein [Acidobacteriota bacterium]
MMDTLRAWLHALSEQLHALLDWVEGFATTPYGGTALFLIAFAESSFFPVPPDVLLIALCLGDPERSLWFALLCTVGSVLGGVLGYGIGFWGGRPVLRRMFPAERIVVVERLFDRYNAWATGIAGLTPLPYKIFTIAGGTFSVNLRIFIIASILARGLRFFVLAGLLYFYGEPIKAFIDRYLNVLSIVFVLMLVAGYWLLARAGKRTLAADNQAEMATDNELAP